MKSACRASVFAVMIFLLPAHAVAEDSDGDGVPDERDHRDNEDAHVILSLVHGMQTLQANGILVTGLLTHSLRHASSQMMSISIVLIARVGMMFSS